MLTRSPRRTWPAAAASRLSGWFTHWRTSQAATTVTSAAAATLTKNAEYVRRRVGHPVVDACDAPIDDVVECVELLAQHVEARLADATGDQRVRLSAVPEIFRVAISGWAASLRHASAAALTSPRAAATATASWAPNLASCAVTVRASLMPVMYGCRKSSWPVIR